MIVIRLILSAVMLYFIYFETGVVTTVLLGLALIGQEMNAYHFKKIDNHLELVADEFKKRDQE